MPPFSKFAGLYTSHNYVNSVGWCGTADNVVINEQDTVESRRGQKKMDYGLDAPANELFVFEDTLLVQSEESMYRDTGTEFEEFEGTFTPVDDTLCRMRSAQAAENLYVNTADGVKVLSEVSGEFSDAGVPPALDVYTYKGPPSATGFLANDRAVAYRAVFGQYDAHGQLRLGAPSQRTVEVNTPIIADIGDMIRNNTSTVNVNTGIGSNLFKYVAVGSPVVVAPGEANFPAGTYNITSTSESNQDYTDGISPAGLHQNTVAQSITTGARNNIMSVTIPPGVVAGDICRLHRTEIAPTASVDPGDECYLIAEAEVPADRTIAIGGVSGTSGIFTVTSSGHPYSEGQWIEIGPAESGIAAGVFVIRSTTSTTFTYFDPNNTGSVTSLATKTVSARSIAFLDNVPDAFLGDPLYTNPNTGDGLAASNYAPPRSLDIAAFSGALWFANTVQPHRLEIQLLGRGSPNGLQNADTITFTISGVSYTYTASEIIARANPNTRAFRIAATGTTARDIEAAAIELCNCINLDPNQDLFRAVYVSAENDPPGKILIFETGVGGDEIACTVSRPSAWAPVIPTSGTDFSSDNDAQPAGLAWSKDDQPEAVPLSNTLRAAAKNDPIWRIFPCRDSLFVFKQRGGVYRVPNQAPFRAVELDGTCKLLAPDAVASLDNRVYALSDQGLVILTEAGMSLVGWPLDYDFRALLSTARDAVRRLSFAVAYESERQIQLWLPSSPDDECATQSYWYNHATQAFTRVPLSRTCGLVSPADGKLYMGGGENNAIYQERKDFTEDDYQDESDTTIVLASAVGTRLTLPTAGLEVGDILQENEITYSTIASVDSESQVTVEDEILWTNGGTVTVYKAIPCDLKLVPQSLGDPGVSRHIGRATYSFREAQFSRGRPTISTDDDPTTHEYLFETPGFGGEGFGSGQYGNPSAPINRYTVFGTMGSFVVPGFAIRQARSKWKLLSINMHLNEQGDGGK